MIRITVSNNVDRKSDFCSETDTLRAALEKLGFQNVNGSVYIDGAPLQPGDMNKTMGDLGYGGDTGNDDCYVSLVVATKNA